jgi:hypothetical protein
MGISDIIQGIQSKSGAVVVNMADSAFHVKIHGIELGIRDMDDPDTSHPNPLEIRYTQEMEIVIHKTLGQKPLTQCTIPEGLWSIFVRYTSLKGADGALAETLKKIKGLTAGPRKFYSALFDEGLCTYIQRKEIVQTKGTKDWMHTVELTLIEANGGDL